MRVVFDTNTIISALLFRGTCHFAATLTIKNLSSWQLQDAPIFW